MKHRKWQSQALDVLRGYRRIGKDRALIAACPGAGKTYFTVSAWTDPDVRGDCDVIVVVVPSRALKAQWRKSFESAGIGAIADVPNEDLEARAHREDEMFDPARPVQIFTYAQIAAYPALFRILSARHRVFAVFDEIHHADDDATFGEALVTAFDESRFKLSLSGTPFNTRGGRLAFCETEPATDDQGRRITSTKSDFSYAYGDALSAAGTDDDPDVVRPVQFVRWNGVARWQKVDANGEFKEKSVTGARKTDPLWPLLDMEGEYLKRMIDAALDSLNGIREHHANAGMLITAMDRDHCEQIAAYLRGRGIHDHRVIMHDTPRASESIRDFERSRDRVLIAIKMISEGVDIKRLRVGVYASKVMTQMFFIQFIGRFIRWDGSLPAGQFASVFIPEHVTLIRYALEIERMVVESEVSLDGPGGDAPKGDRPASTIIGLTSIGDHNGVIQHSDTADRSEVTAARELLSKAGLVGRVSEHNAVKIMRVIAEGGVGARIGANGELDLRPTPPEPSESRKNDKLVARIVAESQKTERPLTYLEVNLAANRAVGIAGKDSLTPIAVLERRTDFLKRMLVSLRNPRDAA